MECTEDRHAVRITRLTAGQTSDQMQSTLLDRSSTPARLDRHSVTRFLIWESRTNCWTNKRPDAVYSAGQIIYTRTVDRHSTRFLIWESRILTSWLDSDYSGCMQKYKGWPIKENWVEAHSRQLITLLTSGQWQNVGQPYLQRIHELQAALF